MVSTAMGNIAVAGDKDDGQGRMALDQLVLQLQARHAMHANIGNQASDFAGIVTR